MAEKLIPIGKAEPYGLPRSSAYKKLATGELKAVKVGSRTYLRESDLQAFVESLPAFKPKVASRAA